VAGYRSLGIVANIQRAGVPETVRTAVAWLKQRSLNVRAEPEIGAALGLGLPAFSWTDLSSQIDLLLTFGGDGTILFAARRLAGQQVPIFGVNTGTLGFLTSSSRESMAENFELLFQGLGRVETYMTLSATPGRASDGGAVGDLASRRASGEFVGLNDVVVHKGAVKSRVLDLRLEVDGDEVGTYVADGLILATPVGSTGYALSAQGPLVVPTMEAIVVTPICPHTLAIRPLVLPPRADVRVTVLAQQEPASLAVDGVVVGELEPGDAISVTQGRDPVRLVRLPERSFFRLLRSKLFWGGRASLE
jgi:NAD+ kinase